MSGQWTIIEVVQISKNTINKIFMKIFMHMKFQTFTINALKQFKALKFIFFNRFVQRANALTHLVSRAQFSSSNKIIPNSTRSFQENIYFQQIFLGWQSILQQMPVCCRFTVARRTNTMTRFGLTC